MRINANAFVPGMDYTGIYTVLMQCELLPQVYNDRLAKQKNNVQVIPS